MNTNLLAMAAQLSDDALLARMKSLAEASREVTVELIAHLAEVGRRKLHRGEGPGKLFGYCTQVLRFSEAAAWNRIKAARAVRKFPIILDLLADGALNLTTIRLLSPHLTAENHRALLAEATGMTRRQVDKLVARLAPKPDGVVITPAPAAHRPVVAPLSPERYRLQLTIGEDGHDDLRCLQDLLRREIPDGDPAAIVARALKLLRKEAEKKASAATPRPRPGQGTKPGSRDIPANVERTVWQRNGGQCAFVARNGRRCTARSYIEFHHERPHAAGGEPTVENIALRCREHNEYESELIFGPFEPQRVREAPPMYGGPFARTGPGTSKLAPREMLDAEREVHI